MRQLVLEKENSEFKPVELRLKIDLVSYPARAKRLGKYDILSLVDKAVMKFITFLYSLSHSLIVYLLYGIAYLICIPSSMPQTKKSSVNKDHLKLSK